MGNGTNPYRTSRPSLERWHSAGPPVAVYTRALVSRTLALVLAIGATPWALVCLFLNSIGSWDGLLVAVPGYLVTCGYYWRAIGRPSQWCCRGIWGCSLLVQGGWLTHMLTLEGSIGDSLVTYVIITWWTTSSIVSLAGLLIDPGEQARG